MKGDPNQAPEPVQLELFRNRFEAIARFAFNRCHTEIEHTAKNLQCIFL